MSNEKIWLKSYDKHVPATLTYPTEDLGTILTQNMTKYADNVGFYFMDRTFLFKEILKYSQKFATFLQKNGLNKGDVVAICLANSPQYLFAVYGTYIAGGTVTGCSPLLSPEEMAYQMKDSGAKFLITMDILHEKVISKIYDRLNDLKVIVPTNISEFMGFGGFKVFMGKLIKKIPKGKIIPWPGKTVVPFLVALETEIDLKKVDIDPKKDLALIQYTGGTTGLPKGVDIVHSNLMANIHQFDVWVNREKGKEILLSAFPFFHVAGFLIGLFLNYLGGAQILIANPRDTDHIIKEIIDKKPSSFGNVPTLFLMVQNNPMSKKIPPEVLDNISLYVSGAAPFPPEAIREFEKQFHTENKFVEVYGMTETAVVICANPMYGEKKIGTVGLPWPDTDIKLIDTESGADIKEIGQPGEILIKGPSVVKQYHNKPEATAATFDKDGYVHTGDVGVFDEDGYLKIVDRTKDMLIVSGFKVYSVHVEEVMTKHPDIQILAIIGVPNPDRPGAEIVKAVIQLKEGVEAAGEVKDSIKKYAEENLSKYEVPKIWDFREELPLTMVGKVLKKALREEEKK
ncbi:MAG: AMP-dependent synthetase [Promethearchaeota archaeon Loki_b32]|nr:MAG: AMP-dependent synthetase [Candidatus Lokiarchaeota archaeon Loki_b32]